MPAYSVVRSIEIKSDPQSIFDVVSDFNTWTTWSPWLISEPDAMVAVTSDGRSVGAVYSWVGNVTGSGEVEHKQLVPGKLVDDEIRFLKPFRSDAKVAFHLEPVASGTKLSWTMDGRMPWFLFWMIPFLKTFIGMDYMRGLRMLKDWIELGRIPTKTIQHGVEETPVVRMAGVPNATEVEQVGPSMDATFSKARRLFQENGLPMTGPMISVYTKFQVSKGIFNYISGFVIPNDLQVPASSGLKVWSAPATRAFRVEHIGPYRHLGNAWSVANQIVRFRKMKQRSCGAYEIYRTTPENSAENDLKTDIYLPLK